MWFKVDLVVISLFVDFSFTSFVLKDTFLVMWPNPKKKSVTSHTLTLQKRPHLGENMSYIWYKSAFTPFSLHTPKKELLFITIMQFYIFNLPVTAYYLFRFKITVFMCVFVCKVPGEAVLEENHSLKAKAIRTQTAEHIEITPSRIKTGKHLFAPYLSIPLSIPLQNKTGKYVLFSHF